MENFDMQKIRQESMAEERNQEEKKKITRRDFLKIGAVIGGGLLFKKSELFSMLADEESDSENQESKESAEKFLNTAYREISEARGRDEDEAIIREWVRRKNELNESIKIIQEAGENQLSLVDGEGNESKRNVSELQEIFNHYNDLVEVIDGCSSGEQTADVNCDDYKKFNEMLDEYGTVPLRGISQTENLLYGALSNYLKLDPFRFKDALYSKSVPQENAFNELLDIVKKDVIAFDRFRRASRIQSSLKDKLTKKSADRSAIPEVTVDGLMGFGSLKSLRRVLEKSNTLPLNDEKGVRLKVLLSDDFEYRKLLKEIDEAKPSFSYEKPIETEVDLNEKEKEFRSGVYQDVDNILGKKGLDPKNIDIGSLQTSASKIDSTKNFFKKHPEIQGTFNEAFEYFNNQRTELKKKVQLKEMTEQEALERARILFTSAIDKLSDIHANKQPIKLASGEKVILPFDEPNLDCSTFLNELLVKGLKWRVDEKNYTKWPREQVPGYSKGEVIKQSNQTDYKNLNQGYENNIEQILKNEKLSHKGLRAIIIGAEVYRWQGSRNDLGHMELVFTNENGELVAVEKVNSGSKKTGLRANWYDSDFFKENVLISDLLSDENMKSWLQLETASSK